MNENIKEKIRKDNSRWLKNDISSAKIVLPIIDSRDYRQIPLFPTLEDISKTPNLYGNNVNHPYGSCNKYLNTFFHLMREDFVSVVRDTVCTLNGSYDETDESRRNRINMNKLLYYKDAYIQKTMESGTTFIKFRAPSNRSHANEKNNFKNGSLLLFSQDQFTTFSLGIVSDTFKLNDGIVGVDFVEEKVKNWCFFDLLEPQAFYEPYRYVMGVLQDMDQTNFPMKKYIVYGSKYIAIPSYLESNSIYNINGIKFNICEENQWPSNDVLNMDINQYEAFKGALTKEFAMIQGPPGTGKTYIGLEIMKVIIENMYKTKKLTKPILVVCMTNHALDQFLEGIWKITRNIARFGYGTKSNILVDYIPKVRFYHGDICSNLYLEAQHSVILDMQEENLHMFNIKEVRRNEGVLDLSYLTEVFTFESYAVPFQNSYDLLSWLFYDIPFVDNIDPIYFIRMNKLLFSLSSNSKFNGSTNLFCITLQNLKLFRTQKQHQLDMLNRGHVYQYNDIHTCNISEIKDLELLLKIMKTVEDYLIEHLKLFTSYDSKFFYNMNKIDCNSLRVRDRWLLYYHWVHFFLNLEEKCLESLEETVSVHRRDTNKFKSIGYFKSVKNKYVIGMTTTAAAKNRYLLKNLKCPIVIIEEAAEVLEPHIVASLNEHCKHLILIGDHKQLRPHTASYIIKKKYKLDISLFERMVNNNIPSYALAEQHRMRQEIVSFVTPHIYPNLRNHPSVMERPNIRGVAMNVFFLDHNAMEQKVEELISYTNIVEAKFLVEFASYLLKQGYYPEDITIMAMYNAQVLYITNLFKSPAYKHLKDIRVSTVDGYQGEENEIILLSLVRNNNNNNVGFLMADNRVCVALSRARLGFYMVGNLKLLAAASDLWKSVENHLYSLNATGPTLSLKCQHNKTIGNVSKAEDFNNLVNCESKCNAKLSCGHLCDKVCHLEDFKHMKVKCLNPCEKICFKNHKCNKICYEKCNPCQVIVKKNCFCNIPLEAKCCDIDDMKCKTKETLNCGHIIEKSCVEPSICNQICNISNSNCLFGHLCKKLCGEPCGLCTASIPVIMDCEHVSEFSCSQHFDLITYKNSNDKMERIIPFDINNLQCEELVLTYHTFACGHTELLHIPCYLIMNESLKNQLKNWKKKNTSFKLDCGHLVFKECSKCTATKIYSCNTCA